ncbi:MAG TPA: TPM domain-containing protein [Treponemataceae bacterium]|nr:TPM domain-containing protein [Treponemataceae bacterium]
MKTKKVVTLLLCTLLAFGSTCAEEGPSAWSAATIPNPTEAGTGYVTSIGGYLTDEEIASINELIVGIEKDTSVEIAVVVVPSLAEDIFTESQALFDAWKIGKADKDNGLLIVASIEDRDFRTHTGYGMEGVFTDAAISLLQETIVIPEFRQGRYGKGIIDYVTEIGRLIRDPTALEELSSPDALSETTGNDDRTIRERISGLGDELVPFLIFGGVGFLILLGAAVSFVTETRAVLANRKKQYKTYTSVLAVEGKGIGKQGFSMPAFLFPFGAVFFSVGLAIGDFLGFRQIAMVGLLPPAIGLALSLVAMLWSGFVRKGIIERWRKDPRLCPECGGEMKRLSETDDDAYLLPTQIREEEIKSEDYDVHVCSACGASTIEKFRGSRYSLFTACPSCKAMASRQKNREVIRRPSYTLAGEALLHFECQACSHAFTKSTSIPKLTRSSGSSGSSGGSSGGRSSFGGGSSGGGGSSSSW